MSKNSLRRYEEGTLGETGLKRETHPHLSVTNQHLNQQHGMRAFFLHELKCYPSTVSGLQRTRRLEILLGDIECYECGIRSLIHLYLRIY